MERGAISIHIQAPADFPKTSWMCHRFELLHMVVRDRKRERMPTTVADVMSRDPAVVRPDSPLKDAIRLLAEKRISGLPVVDDHGKLVGVISESDLMWQETGVTPPAYIMVLDSVIYLENPARYDRELHKALGQTVAEVMTKDTVTIAPDKSLREAAHLMHDRHVRRLPVVTGQGKLIGILTRGDIVRFMATQE
jgi:CBS domain-containing protein